MVLRILNTACIVTLFIGCAGTPKIPYSQLYFSDQINPFKNENIGSEYLLSLINKTGGMQFGDLIFSKNTKVYWIIPEIDKVDLEIMSHEEQFGADEYKKRQEELKALHENYLIFSLDLRMPFYPGWTQNELYDFLRTNLSVTLENGTGSTFFPDQIKFNVFEKYLENQRNETDNTDINRLEVQMPVRVTFNKNPESGPIITESINKICIKLRLEEAPPFKIGFFDDKFFQGFLWKIILD